MKYLRITFIAIVFSLIGISLSKAQTNYIHYTPDDGLLQTQCEYVMQDSKGYIYIGTKAGISRFNGIDFENFDHEQSIIGNRILSIEEHPAGTIWAFSTHAVFKIVDNRIKSYNFPHGYFYSNHIFKKNDLYLINQKNNSESPLSLFRIKNDSLKALKLGDFLKSASHGMFFKTQDSESLFIQVHFEDTMRFYEYQAPDSFKEIGEYSIIKNSSTFSYENEEGERFSLVPKSKGELYYLTPDNSLYILTSKGPERTNNTLIYSHLEWNDENNNLILRRNENIIYKPAGKPEELICKLPSVIHAMRDSEDNFWIAAESGLYRITPFFNFNTEDGIAPVVWSIAEFPKGVIRMFSLNTERNIGNRLRNFDYNKGKISRFENKYLKAFQKYQSNSELIRFYMGSQVLSDSNLYIISNKGVFRLDNEGVQHLDELPESESFFVYEDSLSQKVFFGLVEGLYQFDFSEKKLKFEKKLNQFSHSDFRIALCMERGTDGAFYIGTGHGLGIYDLENLQFMHKDTMPYAGIRSIYKDYKGNLWLGSENGLWFFDYKHLKRIKHPELNRQISALIEGDKRNMLIGARRGIAIMDLRSFYKNDQNIISFYDHTAGYFGGEVGQNGLFKDSKGNIWIAGKNKVVRFQYTDLFKNPKAPKIYIEKVSIQSNLSELKIIENNSILESDENNPEFVFSGISHGTPGQIYFKHQLVNFDKHPSLPDQDRQIAYKNLPPGEYIFKLWASNESGTWSETPATFYFRIKEPTHKQTWFIILEILFLTAATALLTLLIYKSYKRRKINKKKLINLQMQALTGQLYPHFLYNAVTNISNAIYQKKPDEAYHYTTKLIHLVRIVHESRKRSALKINEEIVFIKTYLEIQKYRFGERFNYRIDVKPNTNLQKKIPQMLIQSFVENAVKHGLEPLKSGGLLHIEIAQKQNYIHVEITDNGVGLQKSKSTKIFGSGKGMRITNEMVSLFNKQHKTNIRYRIIDLYKTGGKGTKAIIYIPN